MDKSEPPLERKVWNQRELHQPGDRIIPGEGSFDVHPAQGPDVRPPIELALEEHDGRGRHVRREAHPADPRLGTNTLDRTTELIAEQHRRKIHAGPGPERVVAPGPGVDVQEFEATIALVALVLELDEPVVVDRLQKALRERLELRHVRRLDERARAAEVTGMLAGPPAHHSP